MWRTVREAFRMAGRTGSGLDVSLAAIGRLRERGFNVCDHHHASSLGECSQTYLNVKNTTYTAVGARIISACKSDSLPWSRILPCLDDPQAVGTMQFTSLHKLDHLCRRTG